MTKTLDDLAWERYETGAHGGTHLRIAPGVADAIPRSEQAPPWVPNPKLDVLFGIPLLIDEDLPPNTWRLVDNATGGVLHEGTT